ATGLGFDWSSRRPSLFWRLFLGFCQPGRRPLPFLLHALLLALNFYPAVRKLLIGLLGSLVGLLGSLVGFHGFGMSELKIRLGGCRLKFGLTSLDVGDFHLALRGCHRGFCSTGAGNCVG